MGNIIKNLLFTGKRNIGKSTLINEILSENPIVYGGFRTLPYYINGEEAGYYMECYCNEVISNPPISFKIGDKKPVAIKEAFDLIGVDVLEKSLVDNKRKVILLDEIGVLEECSLKFKDEIIKVLMSDKPCLGVIKKKDIEFLNDIRSLKNTLVIDLEEIHDYVNIKKKAIEIINSYMKEIKI